MKREALIAVAYHWGVSQTTVWKWRKALGVERWNAVSTALAREWEAGRVDGRFTRAREKSRAKSAIRKLRRTMPAKLVPVDAARVRAARRAWGWTQVDLAERAGVGKHTVWRIETGWCKRVTPEVAGRLLSTLG